jgi:hypothetical protein
MAALSITAAEAALGTSVRISLESGFKEGTDTSLSLDAPVALNTIPAVVLDLYEIAFLAALKTMYSGGVPLPSFTVAGVGSAVGKTGYMVFISNESGGAVVAFSDGTNWRRVTDRAIVS